MRFQKKPLQMKKKNGGMNLNKKTTRQQRV